METLMIRPESPLFRFVVFVCIFGFSGVRFLAQNYYPPITAEALSFLLILFVLSGALALATRRRAIFYAVVLLSLVAMATDPARRLVGMLPFAASWPLRFYLVSLTAGIAAAMYLLKRNFFKVFFVWTLSALAVDVVQYWLTREPDIVQTVSASAPAQPLSHVLYVVLDEHIGSAGWPGDIPESQQARADVERTYLDNGFRLYPFAYANYGETIDSLSSIMGFHIVSRAGEYAPVSGDLNRIR